MVKILHQLLAGAGEVKVLLLSPSYHSVLVSMPCAGTQSKRRGLVNVHLTDLQTFSV